MKRSFFRILLLSAANAEIYAAEILKQKNPLDPTAQRFQGGSFVTQDYTPRDKRPGGLS